MPRRPSLVPTFATSASAGQIVEPVTLTREGGFVADARPPAPWFNWLFYNIGENLDFLRGPHSSQWTRYTITPGIQRIDVDALSAEGTTPLHRIVGCDTTTAGTLYSSVRGNDWKTLTMSGTASFGTAKCLMFDTANPKWVIGIDDGAGGGKIWLALASGAVGSAIDDPTGTACTATTVPGGTTPIVQIVLGEVSRLVAITASKVMYSLDNGATWTNAGLSAVPTGSFYSVCYTGQAWVAITTAGEVYRTTDATSTWTKLGASLGGVYNWKCATDGSGNVYVLPIAGVHANGSWLSTDHGATWASQTAPVIDGVTNLTWIDGSWFLTASNAPYIASANDTASTSWLRLPVPYIEGVTHTLYTVRVSEGALVAPGVGHVLVSDRARDLSPSAFTPSSTAAPLYDAAYLQGEPISATVPTLATQRLGWNPTNSDWEPVDAYRQPLPFGHGAIAASTTAGQYNYAGQLSSFVAVRDGSIVGLSSLLSGNAAGSALGIAVYKNGVITAATNAIAVGASSAHATFTAGAISFAAGDTIDVRLTTDGLWTGTTLTATSTVEILA